MVEVAGFEPAAFWSRTKRATKLRYTSKKNGANEGTRTPDLLITNQLLYRLSYIGIPLLHQRRILYQREKGKSILFPCLYEIFHSAFPALTAYPFLPLPA